MFRDRSAGFGFVPTITRDAVSTTSVASVPRNRCVSVSHKSEITREVLRALHDAGAEYVSTRSVGLDHIDVVAAHDLGLAVGNVTYAPDGVADYTLMLILMAVRNVKAVVRSAEEHDFRLGRARGHDLCDLTVGVVGTGSIGSAVVRRLQAFGSRVLACSDRQDVPTTAELVSLSRLLARSDVVTLHVPLTVATYHLIGAEQLAEMQRGAFLVNTGRGALVDTGALVSALEHGTLGGVALDVLEGEEGIFYADRRGAPVDHPSLLRLQQLPNAIVTPHTAYFTARALRDTVEQTLVNCLNHERNRARDADHDGRPVRRLLGGA